MSDVRTVYPRIEDAREIVESEIEAVEEEAAAFESFRARLDRLDPTTATSAGSGGTLTTAASVAGVDPESVRVAYRDTVLAMDHYERVYDEPLLENVGAEFGAAVRELLAAEVGIPPMQHGLIEAAAEQAVEERRQFRRVLVAERDSLKSVADRLGDVERRLHGFRATGPGSSLADAGRADRLWELAAACQSLAAERQRSLHQRPAPRLSGVGDRSLATFLYGDHDHRFPALVEITDVARRVDAAGANTNRSGGERGE